MDAALALGGHIALLLAQPQSGLNVGVLVSGDGVSAGGTEGLFPAGSGDRVDAVADAAAGEGDVGAFGAGPVGRVVQGVVDGGTLGLVARQRVGVVARLVG